MTTVLTTFLCLVLFVAALDVAWSIRTLPQPKPVEIPAATPPAEKPIPFDEAYQRYAEHLLHSKYQDRIPVEIERLERHAAIINEQLAVQRKMLEEARR